MKSLKRRGMLKLCAVLAVLLVGGGSFHEASAYRTTKYFLLEVYPVEGVPFRTLSHLPPMSYFHHYGGESAFINVYPLYSIQAPNNNLSTFQQLVEQEGLGPANYLPLDPGQAQNRGKGRLAKDRQWYR
ncbi:hypothetical protein LGV61_07085 [Desulfurispirillum indicum]|uniref:hypothetical protein n=1 Tax=Desulfurispirillum indicum TaxID=936456 RepID=UPI001CFC1EA2|nr:hypothetical protein [Desulfurispirillum indicum]UCZ55495.1 hypothetical protein LGV61_07085 [Desulfurispirillum indicum]